MATFNTKNFSEGNTPDMAYKIGNWLLIVGTIGAVIVGAPAAVPALIIPSWLSQVGLWGVFIGTMGKTLTKMLGKSE